MRLPLLLTLLLAAGTARAEGDPVERTRLLRELASEAEVVRERAAARLESSEGLAADDVARALRAAPPRAQPGILRLAAARKMQDLVPQIAAAAAGPDAMTAQAALRALVTLGGDAVAAGRAALAGAEDLDAVQRRGRTRHLDALDAQKRVEHEVLSRWRRKGGSYRGRYAALADLGWEVQPVLLAMLLDIPLEDQFLVVPTTGDADADRTHRQIALRELARSTRRGYRTFDPLPTTIESDELFDLAWQALADVADMALVGEILEEVHAELLHSHRSAGWRARQWEDAFAFDLEVVLAARGAPERLEERRREVEREVQLARLRTRRPEGESASDAWHFYSTRLSELAGVLHQLGRFDESAKRYEEVLRIGRMLTGKESAIAGYNRACALARGGRVDDAIAALARALDPEIASGSEDLTHEWVTEDADLASLRDDPRFEVVLRARFGPR